MSLRLGIKDFLDDIARIGTMMQARFSHPDWLTTGLTSSNFNGDNKSSANNGIIDLSSEFGVPAGIKAVYISLTAVPDAAGDYILLGPSSSEKYALELWGQVASVRIGTAGWIPCDSNGDIYAEFSDSWTSIWMRVWGYA